VSLLWLAREAAMRGVRVFPQSLWILSGMTAVVLAQAPPSLGGGSRVRVERSEGRAVTGVVAPNPSGPLWQFITDKGTPVNYRLDQLTEVRLLGRDAQITPTWPTAVRSFPWAAVKTTAGQLVELGIYRWPTFEIVRDDTGTLERAEGWRDQFLAIAALGARPAAPPLPDFEFTPIPSTNPRKPPGR
jgi:hypothetical protein